MEEQIPLADKVVRELKRKILMGELSINERLPSERELAERYKVSRITIREAISKLGNLGFVHTLPQSGTFISNFRRDGSLDLLIDILSSGEEVERSLLVEFLEIRRMFECHITGRAVMRMREEERKRLDAMVDALIDAIDAPDRMAEIDYTIHTFLMDLADNSVLRIFFNSFRPIYQFYLKTFYSHRDNASGIIPYYERLCRAVEMRNERVAAFVMGELLDYAEIATIALMEKSDGIRII